jgi:nucleotide-binding universal stress UspA family protein
MLPFKKILFPVDFSERCSEAGVYVAAMARHFKAHLTLLHAIDAPPGFYGLDPAIATAAAYAEMIRECRREELSSFLRDELVDLPVNRVVEHGDAAAIIARYARINAMDLIMMPTHGYSPFRRFLLGSVTAKVLHDAECPVWTSAHLEAEREPKIAGYRSVLCAVDRTTESLFLMRSAAQIAEEFGAVLRLVHVIPAPEAMAKQSFRDIAMEPPPRLPKALYDTAREEIRRLQHEAGTNADLCLDAGDVPKIVRTAALRLAADLVVVGRGHIHETLGRLRTHSSAIIRESPCPVLSVYPGGICINAPAQDFIGNMIPVSSL